MSTHAIRSLAGVVAIVAASMSPLAMAQATRTWVSGVGDDANPCSRTAPCKTFAGAISKTAIGGEINAIDPGGFGAVTITKSITIDGGGTLAGILAAGTNGIIINITPSVNDPTPRVVLRNLDINGVGTGLKGIRVLGTASVLVENVTIQRFSQQGIDVSPTGSSDVTLSKVTIRHTAAAGVMFTPTSPAIAFGNIADSVIDGNGRGVHVGNGSSVTISRTSLSSNADFGVAVGGPTRAADVTIDNATIAGNAIAGVNSNGGFAIGRLSNSTLFANAVALQTTNGGQLFSYRTNRIDGNAGGIGVVPTASALQ